METMSESDNASVVKPLIINRAALAIVGAIFPGVACCISIAYIYAFDFDQLKNFTIPVCPGTYGILPPVSYFIGILEPTRTIWLCVMFINFPIRIFYPFFYNSLYKMINLEYANLWWYICLNQCHRQAMILEVVALAIMTIFDTVSKFYVHAVAFGAWLILFNFNMFASILVHYFSGRRKSSETLNLVFHLKCILFIIAITLSLSIPYTYLYSVANCHQITYILFTVTEYILVPINSLFYFFIYWDYSNVSIKLTGE